MKTLIISNGELGKIEYIEEVLNKAPFIICADGGLRHAETLNIHPKLIVGDFDSVKVPLLEKYGQGVETVQLPPEKDETDTQIAIAHAIQRGATEIVLTGVIGTRMDHSYGNLMLLSYLNELGIRSYIIHTNNIVYLCGEGKHVFYGRKGMTMSLLPFGGKAVVNKLEGFKYTVKDYCFTMDNPLGISNEINSNEACINIEKGQLLALLAWD